MPPALSRTDAADGRFFLFFVGTISVGAVVIFVGTISVGAVVIFLWTVIVGAVVVFVGAISVGAVVVFVWTVIVGTAVARCLLLLGSSLGSGIGLARRRTAEEKEG